MTIGIFLLYVITANLKIYILCIYGKKGIHGQESGCFYNILICKEGLIMHPWEAIQKTEFRLSNEKI